MAAMSHLRFFHELVRLHYQEQKGLEKGNFNTLKGE